MTAQEYFIVGKDREWLMTSREDLIGTPHAHLFSRSIYDSRKFDDIRAAAHYARIIRGEIWKFTPATGKKEKIDWKIPEGAKCDTCRYYCPFDGCCRKPGSDFYRVPVSYLDACEDWNVKEV